MPAGHVVPMMLLLASYAGGTSAIVEILCRYPRDALEIAGTAINFRSGKFGYSVCPIFIKGHAEFFREI